MRSRGWRSSQPRSQSSPASEGEWRSPQLGWYVNRLRCMSLAEVAHRVGRTVSIHAQRVGLRGLPAAREPDLAAESRAWVSPHARVAMETHLAAADRILAGRIQVFTLAGFNLGVAPRWNHDPKTGTRAPMTFGKALNYRDTRRVGDIKYLWELNRHLHLVTLAQGYALSGDRRYALQIRRHLESWLAACPYGMGPNWASALEVAIRLINWAVAWQLLGGMQSPLFANGTGGEFRRAWLEAVYQHAEFVRTYFSRYSSANNHLIGEASGLFIAATTWPCWPETDRWRATAAAVLEHEIEQQIAPDGVNREQSVGYQQFTLDLLLLPLFAARANGWKFSVGYEHRIETMLEFLASIMDRGGHLPCIGDSDDAVLVRFDPDPGFSLARSQLASGALLFQRGDFKAKAGALDDRTRWLFGANADREFHDLPVSTRPLPVRRAFVDGGYWILGCDFESDNEIRMVVDAGALGYQSIAAHGHADALSFTLSVGGLEFFIDPGTYVYHTDGAWRRHFRGTGSHNTVRVDGLDQSEQGGNFMWLRKARADCELYSSLHDGDIFQGTHDGYRRLPDPVRHVRRISIDKVTRRITITDHLQMKGEHDVEIMFHCSELCTVTPSDAGYRISNDGRMLVLKPPVHEAGEASVYIGSDAPRFGWVSRRFDARQPAPSIVWRARLGGDCLLRSEIQCDELVQLSTVVDRRRGGERT